MRDFPATRAALEAALAFAAREIERPCNHRAGDAVALRRLLLRAFAELNEGDEP